MSFALSFAFAQSATTCGASEIETEHLFGFTTGSDVGSLGEREFEGATTARFGKRAGRYTAGEQTLSAEFVPLQNLRTEYTAALVAPIGGSTPQVVGPGVHRVSGRLSTV